MSTPTNRADGGAGAVSTADVYEASRTNGEMTPERVGNAILGELAPLAWDPEFQEVMRVLDKLNRMAIANDLTDREHEVLSDDDPGPSWRDVRLVVDEEDPAVRARAIALVELGDRVDEIATAGLVPTGARRNKVEMAYFRLALHHILTEEGPITVRGAFYRMVARGLPKTEQQYDRVQQESVKMRRGHVLPVVPYSSVVDGTRWMRKPNSHDSVSDMLDASVRTYRRAIWRDQDAYVEIWCEKDALSGVLYPVTAEWDVPLMVSRGYSSVTFLHEAAMAIEAREKPAHVYLFVDRDRSGGEIAENIEKDLREFTTRAEIHVHRAAVTEEQIRELDLPTRPPKKKGDPPAVELDAIPPNELQRIVRECIEEHVDPAALERTKLAEAAERDTLTEWLRSLEAA